VGKGVYQYGLGDEYMMHHVFILVLMVTVVIVAEDTLCATDVVLQLHAACMVFSSSCSFLPMGFFVHWRFFPLGQIWGRLPQNLDKTLL